MKPLHWTGLRHMDDSPQHYKDALERPFAPTAAMQMGSIVHGELFGYFRDVAWFDGASRRSKKWDEFEAAHADCDIYLENERERALRIVEALNRNPDVQRVLEDAAYEIPLEWEIDGRPCAGRADILSNSFLADLKVVGNKYANPRRFKYHARDMGWYGQLMWYYDALGYMGERQPEHIAIIAVENTRPYAITVFDFNELSVVEGREKWRELFDHLTVCEKNDHWPAYVEGMAMLDAPWKLKEMEAA